MKAPTEAQILELFYLLDDTLKHTQYSVRQRIRGVDICRRNHKTDVFEHPFVVSWINEIFTVENVSNMKNATVAMSTTMKIDDGALRRLLKPLNSHVIKKAHTFNI